MFGEAEYKILKLNLHEIDHIRLFPESGFSKLESKWESSGRHMGAQLSRPDPRVSDSVCLGQGCRIHISNKLPGAATNDDDQGITTMGNTAPNI